MQIAENSPNYFHAGLTFAKSAAADEYFTKWDRLMMQF